MKSLEAELPFFLGRQQGVVKKQRPRYFSIRIHNIGALIQY